MGNVTDLTMPQHLAVRHILTSPTIAGRATPHIGHDGIRWEPLLVEAETMSSGESLLVRIAYDLWHADNGVALWELPRLLDRQSFRRVVEALAFCRGEVPESGVEAVGVAA